MPCVLVHLASEDDKLLAWRENPLVPVIYFWHKSFEFWWMHEQNPIQYRNANFYLRTNYRPGKMRNNDTLGIKQNYERIRILKW